MTKEHRYKKALEEIAKIKIQFAHTSKSFNYDNFCNLQIAKITAASALIEGEFNNGNTVHADKTNNEPDKTR